MNFRNQAPLVRLLLPFLFGIIISVYTDINISLFFILIPLLLLILLFTFLKQEKRHRWFFGLLVNLFLFGAGFQTLVFNTEKHDDKHFSKYLEKENTVYIRVLYPYVEKEKSIKIIASVKAVKSHDNTFNTSGTAVFYFQKDSLAKQIKYGDCLYLTTAFSEINDPQNPSEFNYKRYLSFQNIYHQAYIKSGNFKFSGINTGYYVFQFCYDLRDRLLGVFTENNVKDDEFAVGSALLLGYEDKLDAEIIQAYSSTGALHVLSVSGLHVAIVFVVFNYMLFFLDKLRYGNIIKASILIFLLWFYAALTGLSPSVLRAATMFSFIIIGKAYKVPANIYNTLAASALLLLIINPFLIMEVGFQLSYLAVIGIVFLQPKIYDLWETDNWLFDQVWIITSVSLAAQIVTFPLGLHYFHQFPVYFLFSNLLVIPLSTIIIYLGIFVFVVAKITVLASWSAQLFIWMVYFLNKSVEFFEHLPYAIIESISITVFETWLIYFLIGFIISFFLINKITFLYASLTLLLILFIFQLSEQFYQSKQKSFIIYNVPKISAFDFIDGNQNIMLCDSGLMNNKSKMLFHVKHNWWDNGVKHNTIFSLQNVNKARSKSFFKQGNFISFYNKKIAIINAPIKQHSKKLNVDYVVLSHNPYVSIKDILENYNFKKLIFDSSNSVKKENEWIKECDELNLNYYSVTNSGAYIENIDNEI